MSQTTRFSAHGSPSRPVSPVREAFTLIEILVVVAIIALLVSILLPSLSRARDEAKNVVCRSNIRQLGMGMRLFAFDHKEYYPEKDRWLTWESWSANPTDPSEYTAPKANPVSGRQEGSIYRYVKNVGAFLCPMDNRYRSYAASPPGDPNQSQPSGHTSFSMSGFFQDLVGNRYKDYKLGAPDNDVKPIIDDGPFVNSYPSGDPMHDVYFKDSILFDTPSNIMLMMEESELSPCNDGHVNWEGYWAPDPSYADPQDKLTTRHHDRGNLAMFDGHVEGISAKTDWNAATVHASSRAGRLYGTLYPSGPMWRMRIRLSKRPTDLPPNLKADPEHSTIGQ